ncbi:PAS domain S-box protein [Methylosinus sp. KRF6]|uniref:sensor histidine kinase n=1 Tax=Methylosinus sp. KRF6 TaxID=2846853 RepID=UPI001C0C09EE|nr:PAS domain-containing sensor histidine kinase [Methylosinus sp. KRF6]MBU3887994.1 PAS domain S-box protein [Methylosinus sp. KRF6]
MLETISLIRLAVERLAVEAAPVAMVMVDENGTIQFANTESERMFGYDRSELIGKPVDILAPESIRNEHASLRKGFLANPSKRPMGAGRDLKATRRNGSEFPVEIGLVPIRTEIGLIVLATIVDITARREAEIASKKRTEELEQANYRLARFAYVASHDLQEPLRKIATFANVIQTALDERNLDGARHAAEVVDASGLRARELIDDLLSYSRHVSADLKLQNLNLGEQVTSVLEDFSESIKENDASVKLEIQPLLEIRADKAQFMRLLCNVLSNSIKYSSKERKLEIIISASATHDGGITLSIRDNGIGFEPAYAETIFEPLKRLHTSQYPGTGIGLAICKLICERHGWQIKARSQLGQGAVFTISIPADLRPTFHPEAS